MPFANIHNFNLGTNLDEKQMRATLAGQHENRPLLAVLQYIRNRHAELTTRSFEDRRAGKLASADLAQGGAGYMEEVFFELAAMVDAPADEDPTAESEDDQDYTP